MSRAPFVDPDVQRAVRTGKVQGAALQLVIGGDMWQRLQSHLFSGDGEEHAAVIAAGVLRTSRGVRLLARDLILAEDGVDFVPAPRAHRRLTPAFVNRNIRYCRDEGLAYLAVHNHGPGDTVGFSSIDLASHERGYPALLDIARGQPVGALVLATDAVAGDVWMPDGSRSPIGETVVVGRNMQRLSPAPIAATVAASDIDDRQARIFGAAGQALLGRLKVGVIGAGGVGLPTVGGLARLGVGHLVVIDPERVELSNLPRLPESRRRDAMPWLTAADRPSWMVQLGRGLSTRKVRLAARITHRARRDVHVEAIATDIANPTAVHALLDCDYVFLAADTHLARAVFNALVFGFCIPGTQVGSKVMVDADGTVGDIFSVVRPIGIEAGCMWCNGLISAAHLNNELLPAHVREAQRYLPNEDAPAPSVITLNAIGVAQALNHFMLRTTGLLDPNEAEGDYRRFEARTERLVTEMPRRDAGCIECGTTTASLRARAAVDRLPTRRS